MGGGSYIIPIDARSTVVALSSSDHEKPARGAKLFLSMLKSCEYGFGANALAEGTSNRS